MSKNQATMNVWHIVNSQYSLHIHLSKNNAVFLMNEWICLEGVGGKKKKLFNSAWRTCLMFPLEAARGGNGPQVRVHSTRGQTDTKRWWGGCDHERPIYWLEPSHKNQAESLALMAWRGKRVGGSRRRAKQKQRRPPRNKRCWGWSLSSNNALTSTATFHETLIKTSHYLGIPHFISKSGCVSSSPVSASWSLEFLKEWLYFYLFF